MNLLIEDLIRNGEQVSAYQLNEYWLDIGKYDDYSKAQKDLDNFL